MSIVYKLSDAALQLAAKFDGHRQLFDRRLLQGVWDIFEEVAAQGDEAVMRATAKFDGVVPQHLVLPTNRFAKVNSGITSRDMVKCATIGKISREELARLQPLITELGSYERLPCHIESARVRFKAE